MNKFKKGDLVFHAEEARTEPNPAQGIVLSRKNEQEVMVNFGEWGILAYKDELLTHSSPKENNAVSPNEDMVHNPAHYSKGMPEGVQVIDVIEAQGFGYNLGNATKYLLRSQFKGTEVQDLEKAVWYLNREIDRLKALQ